ncbi:hypothetical protein PN462_05310 [Spirulina sp. CS-785/01]|uniref:hypothetical protein n=1 Tax=Spirulina sp. CS-785/01 TaxID=3021716 RepID=UPI00232F7C4D|nr:hypothetical protein [Spirulina sp. CS-785/01]MDB9312515.1 hypothetical protein [Spirulina sp. CS-785/01]
MNLRSHLIPSTVLLLSLTLTGAKTATATPTSPTPPPTEIAQNTSRRANINALIDHLNAIDARMYGAYWCPHCNDQKERFGNAASRLNAEIYVECDPRGENPQTQLCIDKKVQGFPSWEINGEMYMGVKSLSELAELSGFDGDI